MSWSFNGGNETYAVLDVGNLPQNGAPVSMWFMVRPSGSNCGFIVGRESGASRVGMLTFADTLFAANATGSSFAVPANEWVVVGFDDNNASSGTVRYHLCTGLATTPTWQHVDGTSGGDRSGTVTELRIGDYDGTHMSGHIAAGCVAAGRLGDAGFEALGVTSLSTWVAAADLAWKFNTAVSSTALVDLTSGGANQTSLTGTPTLDTGQEPPNWSYALGSEVFGTLSAPLGGLTSTIAGIRDVSGTLVASLGGLTAQIVAAPVGAGAPYVSSTPVGRYVTQTTGGRL